MSLVCAGLAAAVSGPFSGLARSDLILKALEPCSVVGCRELSVVQFQNAPFGGRSERNFPSAFAKGSRVGFEKKIQSDIDSFKIDPKLSK